MWSCQPLIGRLPRLRIGARFSGLPGWYRGNKILGAEKNWLGEETPNFKPTMKTCEKNKVPQGSINLPADSDRDKAPVVSTGLMDFGGDQTHDAESGKMMGQVAQLKRNIDSSEDSVTMLIHLIEKAREKIKSLTDRQKNASTFIKDRLEEMNEAVDKLKEEMELRKEAQNSLIGLLWAQARSKNTVVSTPRGRTATNKLAATSPAENPVATPTEKRKRDEIDKAEWSQVLRRGKPRKDRLQSQEVSTPQRKEGDKNRRDKAPKKELKKRQNKPRRRQRFEALLIKPAEGKSYAEVFSDIKAKINPVATGKDIRSIRQTKGGEILQELGRETKDLQAFSDEVKTALGKTGVVKNLVLRVTLELLDLDSTTTTEDVEEALKRELDGRNGEMKVSVSKSNRRGQVIAFVEMNEQVANKLLETSRIKIGWINSRIRPRIVVPRCFKCLEYGHQARVCEGPDRSALCYKCGKGEHKAATCKEPPQCVLFAELHEEGDTLNHIPGSGACKSFRQALEKLKKNQR